MSYYLNQMKAIEKDAGANSGPVMTICLNSLTDAVCIMLEMEDEDVAIASMALFVLNNRKFETGGNMGANGLLE